jgi:hypothetical protein
MSTSYEAPHYHYNYKYTIKFFMLYWSSLDVRMYKVTYFFILNVKVNVSLCLVNYALRHEDVWRSGCIDPCFIGLGTNWRWVVRLTPRPPYPRRKSPQYPLDRSLGGEVTILDLTGTRTWNPRRSSPYRIAIQICRGYIFPNVCLSTVQLAV